MHGRFRNRLAGGRDSSRVRDGPFRHGDRGRRLLPLASAGHGVSLQPLRRTPRLRPVGVRGRRQRGRDPGTGHNRPAVGNSHLAKHHRLLCPASPAPDVSRPLGFWGHRKPAAGHAFGAGKRQPVGPARLHPADVQERRPVGNHRHRRTAGHGLCGLHRGHRPLRQGCAGLERPGEGFLLLAVGPGHYGRLAGAGPSLRPVRPKDDPGAQFAGFGGADPADGLVRSPGGLPGAAAADGGLPIQRPAGADRRRPGTWPGAAPPPPPSGSSPSPVWP